MLPQFGMTEFLLIAVVALIVVGPKDLPLMMRKVGRGIGKMRSMAREFQNAFDDLARQAELDELRKEIEQIKRDNALKQASDDLKAMEQDINSAVMAKHPRVAEEPVDKAATESLDAPEQPAATEDKAEDDRPSEKATGTDRK